MNTRSATGFPVAVTVTSIFNIVILLGIAPVFADDPSREEAVAIMGTSKG